MSKIRFVLRGAWQDCILKLRSFRYISAFVMVLGLAAAVTSGIDRLVDRVGEGVTIWMVPHILWSGYLLSVFRCSFFQSERIVLYCQAGKTMLVSEKDSVHAIIDIYIYCDFFCNMYTGICTAYIISEGLG